MEKTNVAADDPFKFCLQPLKRRWSSAIALAAHLSWKMIKIARILMSWPQVPAKIRAIRGPLGRLCGGRPCPLPHTAYTGQPIKQAIVKKVFNQEDFKTINYSTMQTCLLYSCLHNMTKEIANGYILLATQQQKPKAQMHHIHLTS